MKAKILFLTVLLLLLWSAGDAQNKILKKKTLHFAVPFAFDGNFDPVERNYITLQTLFRSIYGTLFRLDANLNPYPYLVESYEQSGKRVTFRLKKNARFSDGSDIRAEDVIDSIERSIKNNEFPNPVYKLIEGGDAFYQGRTANCKGIKKLGYKGFEIDLKYENIEFEHYFSIPLMSILPRNRDKYKPLCSGAFKVAGQKTEKGKFVLTLERNPYYIGKKAEIDTLVIHFHERAVDCIKSIEAGEPDMFLQVRPRELPGSSAHYNYFKTPIFGCFYLKLNARKGPFKDKQLRTFFKHFIRSGDLGDFRKSHLTIPSDLVLPYNLTGYSVFKTIEARDFNRFAPEKKITIRCANEPSGIRVQLFTLLKEKLKPFNIDLVLSWDSVRNIYDYEKKGSIDLTSLYYLVDVPLSFYFYEVMFTPGHELNLFGNEIPRAMKLLNKYRNETDELKKLRLLADLEKVAQEEAILIPLLNPLSILGYKDRVKNVNIDKALFINFEAIDVQ